MVFMIEKSTLTLHKHLVVGTSYYHDYADVLYLMIRNCYSII